MSRLSAVKPGERVRITDISHSDVRMQLMRWGLMTGSWVTCQAVLPGGPVVIRRHHQEIALGRDLAERIEVELL
jgi:Fe2+ transport system protein FeoA